MCYRFPPRHFHVFVVAALLVVLSVWAEDEIDESNNTDADTVREVTRAPDAESATEHIIGVYYAYRADDTEYRLLRSGLGKPEANEVVDAVVQGFAECGAFLGGTE